MVVLERSLAAPRSRLLATDRHGQVVLFFCYLSLLGGKFSLDRIIPSAPPFDLRWLALLAAGWTAWMWLGVAGRRMRSAVSMGVARLWFVAWAGWLAISVVWVRPLARTETYLTDLWFLVVLTALTWMIATRLSRSTLSVVWDWAYWTGLIYFAGAIASAPDIQGRYSAFGGGPNVFVRVMLVAALAALYLTAKRGRRAFLLALPIFMVGAVLSGSRGGLLAFGAACLLGAWPMLRHLRKSAIVTLGIGLAVIVSGALYFARGLVSTTLAQRYFDQTFSARYDSGRSEIFSQSMDLWGENFWVGAGVDGYWATIGHIVGYEYPHNLLAATAAEGGFVGLSLLTASLFTFWGSSRVVRPRAPETSFYWYAAVFALVAGTFSGDYYDSRLMWMFMGFAAIEGRREMMKGSAPSSVDT